MIRFVVIMIAWYCSFFPAVNYGETWNLRAHPAQGVRVQLQDGREFDGALSRNWDGQWVLSRTDGVVTTFDDKKVSWMSFQKPGAPLGFWRSWRSWGPVILVCGLFTFALAWPWFRERVRETVSNPASKEVHQ